MQDVHDLVYSPEVLDFVKIAKKFSDFLTVDFPEERKEFIESSLIIMPELYSKLLAIPQNQSIFDEPSEKYVTEEDWAEVYKRIFGILGSQNEYIDIPEEDEYDRLELISRDLSEDLADIYQDITDFLEVFRVGNEEVMNDVLWECKLNFENYWGKKLLRACMNLHKSMTRDADLLEKMDSDFEEKHSGREIDAEEWIITKRQNDGGGTN